MRCFIFGFIKCRPRFIKVHGGNCSDGANKPNELMNYELTSEMSHHLCPSKYKRTPHIYLRIFLKWATVFGWIIYEHHLSLKYCICEKLIPTHIGNQHCSRKAFALLVQCIPIWPITLHSKNIRWQSSYPLHCATNKFLTQLLLFSTKSAHPPFLETEIYSNPHTMLKTVQKLTIAPSRL